MESVCLLNFNILFFFFLSSSFFVLLKLHKSPTFKMRNVKEDFNMCSILQQLFLRPFYRDSK